MKIKLVRLLVLVVFLVSFSSLSFADKGCKKCDSQKFEYKVMKKAKMILKNQEELGLSGKQVDQIKELKLNLKKELIKQNAEIALLHVDAEAQIYQDVIDPQAVNKIVEQKYEIKKNKAKYLVTTLAELKTILNDKQKDKLKELYKACHLDKAKSCDKK